MKDLLRILVSPVAWLACFSAVYALQGVLCEPGAGMPNSDVAWARIILVSVFILTVLLQIGLLAALYSDRLGAAPGFVRTVSLTGGWVGLAATVWTLFPTLATSACGS